MEEVWKDIKGFEGLYQISTMGNVKGLNWRNTGQSRKLVPKISNKGYAHVHLYKNGFQKDSTIHRLVAKHFLANAADYQEINHKDENPLNNNVDNLEWCDHLYNVRCYINNHVNTKKKGIPYKQTPKIEQRTHDGTLLQTWDSFIQIKHKLNKNESSIRDCCSGKRQQAYGYLWAFAH